MISLFMYLILIVVSPFLQKKGYNIHIGSVSWNKMINLMLDSNTINVRIDCLRIKTLSINLRKRTIQIKCVLNGARITQHERLKASIDDFEADVSVLSIRNFSIYCHFPDIAIFNISLINDELFIKVLLSTKDLYHILPSHQVFYQYIKSLSSEQITILAYHKDTASTAIPRILYQVSGLDKYNDWQPNPTTLKALIISELRAKNHLGHEYVTYGQFPKLIKSIIIACEDPAFMLHYGVCPYAAGLLLKNIFEKKLPKGGGSTLTQQLIKNTFFSEETSIERKLKEAITSFIAERIFNLSKQDILELYLNMAEFGIGVFGIKSAALYFFGKSISDLSPVEVLVLTYILPRPNFFEEALVNKSQQLKSNLKRHILTSLPRLRQRHIIDVFPALPLKGISFSNNLPFLPFDTPALLETISYIVIHCSATRHSEIISIDDLREDHLCRGFDDIGYHWIINIDGTIKKGRSVKFQGAHCRGYNDKSIGICYIGGLDDNGIPTNTMTSNQEKALVTLCTQIKAKYANIQIIGHNQVSDKECPCFDVKELINKHNL